MAEGMLVVGSSESTVKLWEEKIDQLSTHAGNLERKIGELQIQIDIKREELEKLSKELEKAQGRLATVTDKVASGQAANEESAARLRTSLETQEAKANARIDQAVEQEQQAGQAHQRTASLLGHVQAIKTGMADELTHAKTDLVAAIDKVVKALSDLA